MKTFSIISLGCSRNLVDSEVMAGSLKKNGFGMVKDAEKGSDICIVNTCAFIESARQEAVDAVLEAVNLKKEGKVKYIVICGCLSQLYKEKLARQLPEADLLVGTGDFARLPDLLSDLRKNKNLAISEGPTYLYSDSSPRFSLTPKHYAYVKISEGCSNFCSYCIISRLRGEFRSRTMSSVLSEAKNLSKGGFLKEINLVGQDTTLFGIDQYGKAVFPYLLMNLCALKDSVRWIRILYTHPAHYTDELIDTVRKEKKICRYLDLPIQHISDKILKKMNRKTTKKDIVKLIEKLRKKIPGLVLRTSIITGFPGETDKDFKELADFVRDTRFERLGAFIYSKEDGTSAARFDGQVPEYVKKERLDEIMKLQQAVSLDINRSFLGKSIEVLIDEKVAGETDRYLGRTQGDAPEVDGSVFVSGKNIKVGEFCKVKITDAMEYDLVGEKVRGESSK